VSSLADIDRPAVTFDWPPWGRSVTVRAMGAMDLIEWKGELERANKGSERDQAECFGQFLARVVIDPAAEAAAWSRDVRLDSLVALTDRVMTETGLDMQQKKTDSRTTSGSSVLPSADASG